MDRSGKRCLKMIILVANAKQSWRRNGKDIQKPQHVGRSVGRSTVSSRSARPNRLGVSRAATLYIPKQNQVIQRLAGPARLQIKVKPTAQSQPRVTDKKGATGADGHRKHCAQIANNRESAFVVGLVAFMPLIAPCLNCAHFIRTRAYFCRRLAADCSQSASQGTVVAQRMACLFFIPRGAWPITQRSPGRSTASKRAPALDL